MKPAHDWIFACRGTVTVSEGSLGLISRLAEGADIPKYASQSSLFFELVWNMHKAGFVYFWRYDFDSDHCFLQITYRWHYDRIRIAKTDREISEHLTTAWLTSLRQMHLRPDVWSLLLTLSIKRCWKDDVFRSWGSFLRGYQRRLKNVTRRNTT